MSDAAAFFAKKKTKKKKFKAFNANTIDASAVASAQHVDAPEISAEEVASTLAGTTIADAGVSAGDDGWADPAAAWGTNTNTNAASGGDGKVAELLDMRALEAQRNEEDDIAEKLRIEETKAQLAKAKEGMAREAERLKEEKEMKEAKAAGPSCRWGRHGRGRGGRRRRHRRKVGPLPPPQYRGRDLPLLPLRRRFFPPGPGRHGRDREQHLSKARGHGERGALPRFSGRGQDFGREGTEGQGGAGADGGGWGGEGADGVGLPDGRRGRWLGRWRGDAAQAAELGACACRAEAVEFGDQEGKRK